VEDVARGFAAQPSGHDRVLAASLLVYYSVVGFVVAYVTTRTALLRLFELAETRGRRDRIRELDLAATDWLHGQESNEQRLRSTIVSTPLWYRDLLSERTKRVESTTTTASVRERATRLIRILEEIDEGG
jgi:hypothetical protein